jgi:hypothetical protein
MKRFIGQQQDFIVYSMGDGEPVKFEQYQGNMVKLFVTYTACKKH